MLRNQSKVAFDADIHNITMHTMFVNQQSIFLLELKLFSFHFRASHILI